MHLHLPTDRSSRRPLRGLLATCAWLSLSLTLCAPARAQAAPPTPAPLPAAVQAALDSASVPANALAAFVLPLRREAQPWHHQGDRPMQPASTLKVVTATIGLDRLGPDFRSQTELLATGTVEGDSLRGDLVLRGGADTDLGLPELWRLLLELREQGVRHVTGDLLLDRSLFQPGRTDVGLPPFDEAPEFPYNVIPDALHLTGSLMHLELAADATQLRVRTLPQLAGIAFDTAGMGLNDGRCRDWDNTWQLPEVVPNGEGVRIRLKGSFPRGCTVRADLQLIDRDRLAGLHLAAVWQSLGGTWSGRVREASTPPDARLIARRESRPWGEILRGLNKRSDNAQTRLLYLLLGAKSTAPDAGVPTLQRADAEVRRWFAEQGIPAEGLVMDNGSGLSRRERITPRQLASVLRTAWEGRHAHELLMSLPVAGVDGGLRPRFKDSPIAGRGRLKPGTLRNVTALAGVVPDPQGHPVIVVAMINHDRAAQARPALDALVNWVAHGRP